jgi:Ca2+-binding EF-hand superfamily protein
MDLGVIAKNSNFTHDETEELFEIFNSFDKD